MLLRTSKQNKLGAHWKGPAKVIQSLSETSYVVEMKEKQKKVRAYRVNLIKPHITRNKIVWMTLNIPKDTPTKIPSLGIDNAASMEHSTLDKIHSAENLTAEEKEGL